MFPKAPASVNALLRLCVSLFLIALLCVCSRAQQANEILQGAALKDQIAGRRNVIELATKQQSSNDRLGYLWAGLASMYLRDGDFSQSESAFMKALELQRDMPSATRNYATTLDNFGTLYLLYGRVEDAEHYNRMGAKIRERMGYRLDLARSEEHLAEIDLAKHRFKQADGEAEGALRVMREENDSEAVDLIVSLNVLSFTRCLRGRCADGLAAAKESVDLARQRYGERSAVMAHSLMALGFASWKGGRIGEAEPAMRQSIELLQEQTGAADRRGLLLALVEYRSYLRDMQRKGDVEMVERELAAAKTQVGSACADCVNVKSLFAR